MPLKDWMKSYGKTFCKGGFNKYICQKLNSKNELKRVIVLLIGFDYICDITKASNNTSNGETKN